MAPFGCVLARRSSDLAPFFFEIQLIGAGNPVFGPFPIDPQFLEGLANGFATDQSTRPAQLENLFGDQIEGPQTGFVPPFAGGRCKSALKASASISSTTLCTRWGWWEPAQRAAGPDRLKAWMALRTVCWSQKRAGAMLGTLLPWEAGQQNLAASQDKSV